MRTRLRPTSRYFAARAVAERRRVVVEGDRARGEQRTASRPSGPATRGRRPRGRRRTRRRARRRSRASRGGRGRASRSRRRPRPARRRLRSRGSPSRRSRATPSSSTSMPAELIVPGRSANRICAATEPTSRSRARRRRAARRARRDRPGSRRSRARSTRRAPTASPAATPPAKPSAGAAVDQSRRAGAPRVARAAPEAVVHDDDQLRPALDAARARRVEAREALLEQRLLAEARRRSPRASCGVSDRRTGRRDGRRRSPRRARRSPRPCPSRSRSARSQSDADRAEVVADEDDRLPSRRACPRTSGSTSPGTRRRRPRAPRRRGGCRTAPGSRPRTRGAAASRTSSSSAAGRRSARARRTRESRRSAPRPARRVSPISIALISMFVRGAELGVEADAELDEGREPSADPHRPGVGAVDAGEHLEQRALAAAVRRRRCRRTRPRRRRT